MIYTVNSMVGRSVSVCVCRLHVTDGVGVYFFVLKGSVYVRDEKPNCQRYSAAKELLQFHIVIKGSKIIRLSKETCKRVVPVKNT